MKKSIASLALLVASTNANALIGPGVEVPEPDKFCLAKYDDNKGNTYLGDCDESANNLRFQREITENGCAEGQALLQGYNLNVPACVHFIQL